MRGSIRKRGRTYTWYVFVPDPATGKPAAAEQGRLSDQAGMPGRAERCPGRPSRRHVRRDVSPHHRQLRAR